MDHFLKTGSGFETTLKLIETINRSTDDYLFIWDIAADTRWFFGDIDQHYDIRKDGSQTNSTKDMQKIMHPADRDAVLKSLADVAKGVKDTHNMDYRWINRRGEIVWINCHGTVIRDDEGKPHIMLGRVSEENLRHLYNPLTSLWNKNKLREDLKTYLQQNGGYLMFLDIDGLAAINLTHGRDYGDMLLKETAALLETFPNVRMAYHIDHNNFAVVLNGDTEESVQTTYDRIGEAMQEKCTFTAGAVPIDKSLFLDETQLLDSINVTIAKAKERSHNRLEFFSTEDLSAKIASLALLEELKMSIENDFEGFEVFYQPQLKAGSYELYGVEALLRYRSKTRGMVFPNETIPVLEQSRLIEDVGLWVLKTALLQCKKWRETIPDLHVSVNFSALQFEDVNLAEKVVQIVRDAGLTGDALTVEITESMELHRSEQLIKTIKYLKSFGVYFSIDDFGTGYSNLGYLKQLNVDEIKIDRVFVSGLETNTYNHKLVSNVIEFARSNAIRTCCEGVEKAEELVVLELLLPDVIQGFLFDKPTTATAIERSYIDPSAAEYSARTEFVRKLYEFKEKMGVLKFDPRDILRENGVGLWVMRVQEADGCCEMYMDETMEQIVALDKKCSPKECYEYLASGVHPQDRERVHDSVRRMLEEKKAIQTEFLWKHPEEGYKRARLSGIRVGDADGRMVLEGYYRMIDEPLKGEER